MDLRHIRATIYFDKINSNSYSPLRIHINKYMNIGGEIFLIDSVELRAIELGEYIVKNKATVRMTADAFSVSKSTVHIDVTKRLRSIDSSLYSQVREILDVNKAQRHIRGGQATKEKYKNLSGKEND